MISSPLTAGIEANRVSVILIISAFVLQILFFAPLQVLAQNFGEFSVRYLDVVLIQLALSMGVIVILYLLARLLKSPVLLSALTFLSVIAFLESRFFLGLARHEPFDGKPIDWQSLQWLSYLELGTVLALGALFVLIRKRTQLFSAVSTFILVFLTGGLIYAMVVKHDDLLLPSQTERSDAQYFDRFYRLSSQRNVIHIVPDQTQGAMVNEILVSDYARYADVFDGFTLFTQAVGRYPSTYPSVVYYMAGETPEAGSDLVYNQPFTWQYIEEVLRERSILTLLARNSFATFGFQFHPGIFCKGPYTACIGTHDEVFAGVSIRDPTSRLFRTILTTVDLGLFQMAPIALREQVYADGRWFLESLVSEHHTHSGVLEMFTQKMQVEENPGTYNYIHHAGAHSPILFDRECSYIGSQPVDFQSEAEQVRCTLKQLGEMIQALKKTGVYDQTMIVINGDHGTPWLPPSLGARTGNGITDVMMGRASTLVLIKPPRVRGPLRFSSQAVTTGDIPATIADAFGLENMFPGIGMFKENPMADRERFYFSYDSPSKVHNLQALPNLARYHIRGNVFDSGDWAPPNTDSFGEYPSQLRMDQAGFLSYAQGFSWLEQHQTPVRWVDGKQAWVFLSPPQHRPLVLVFDSFVPAFIEGQSIEISIGGRTIAKLEGNELSGKRHVVPIPDDLQGTGVLKIEFNMGQSMRTGNDTRQLSVLFSYIGLEPAG